MKFPRQIILSWLVFMLMVPVVRAMEMHRVNREVHLMGTVAVLEIYAADRDAGLDQLEALIRALEATDRELSTWKPESTVSRLNRHPLGHPFSVEGSLCDLFNELELWYLRTGGAFDPAIGSLIEAWSIDGGGRIPGAQELEAARDRAGFEHLEVVEGACAVVRKRDVRVDVGGFGKGEALDRALAHAMKNRFDGWMVDLGGQVLVHGTPPETGFWPIALAHPGRRDEVVFELAVTSGSLATSGGSERDVQAGDEMIGHVLDPRTGHTVVRDASVTVWHAEALVADILSTALYVMGVEDGLAWAEENDLAVCFLTPDDNGEVQFQASSGFAERFFIQ